MVTRLDSTFSLRKKLNHAVQHDKTYHTLIDCHKVVASANARGSSNGRSGASVRKEALIILSFGVSRRLENRKLPLCSLHITEFKHCDFQMNVASFCLIRSLKTELEPHYNTLPECYMNLIIL